MDEPVTLRNLLYAESADSVYLPSPFSFEELILEQ